MNSQLQLWRNSFTLVPNNASVPGACKKGKTFRGGVARNSSVEFGQKSNNCPDLGGASLSNMNKLGTAKPGPTAITDSSLVRKKRIQVRTKSTKAQNPLTMDGKFSRTFRGDNAHVENGRDGFTLGSRTQLFGHENNKVPAAGVRGDASDVIYFKKIFERSSLNVRKSSQVSPIDPFVFSSGEKVGIKIEDGEISVRASTAFMVSGPKYFYQTYFTGVDNITPVTGYLTLDNGIGAQILNLNADSSKVIALSDAHWTKIGEGILTTEAITVVNGSNTVSSNVSAAFYWIDNKDVTVAEGPFPLSINDVWT